MYSHHQKENHIDHHPHKVFPSIIFNHKKIYQIAVPAILMQSVISFMTVFMNLILVQFADIAVSVFNIYYKLQQFLNMAVLGITNALIPIIAYNYGAKRTD